jgi:hypothetical protein
MLMLDDRADHLNGSALRALSSDQALVASTSDAMDVTPLAGVVLPGRSIVAIRLDPARLLDGMPVAWESLDLLLLDAAAMQRIDDPHRSALLSAGTVLAAVGAAAPDANWPWQSVAGAANVWVLRHDCAGPINCNCGESGYAPTLDWAPGWPLRLRWEIGAAACGLAILAVLAATKVRPRWALPAVAALCVASTAGVAAWRNAMPRVSDAGGDVLVVNPAEQLAQRDAWLYQRGRRDGPCTVPWTSSTHPMLTDSAQAAAHALRLMVAPDGRLQFVYRATPGTTLAFMRRVTTPLAARVRTSAPRSLGHSPMAELARAAYLAPGVRAVGESAGPPQRWPSVVLSR